MRPVTQRILIPVELKSQALSSLREILSRTTRLIRGRGRRGSGGNPSGSGGEFHDEGQSI